MKKYVLVIFLMLMGLIVPLSPVLAETSPPSISAPVSLSFIEIQITGSNEFITIQNNTAAPIDLGTYWIYQHNKSNPQAAGATTSTQQLPGARLNPGQTLLLSANAQNTCGAEVAGRLNVSLVDSEGSLELLASTNSVIASSDTDFVSWNGPNKTITDTVASATPQPVFYRYHSGSDYLWQKAVFDGTNPCQLNVMVSGVLTPGPGGLLVGSPPPATIISPNDGSQSNSSYLPVGDIGLAAPQINELLPNPAEPQTDSEDEFIELYNSNDVVFDLTGFKLQTGTTSLHTYTFPAGSSLLPKSFTAFYSIDTGLSLSNTSGQARLLDPAGNTISQSDIYGTAPDGQSWALANGNWYFTTTSTASGANVINQPLSVKTLSVGNATAAAKKSATTATKTTAAAKVKTASTSSGNSSSSPAAKNASPLHPLVLAGVGAGAVAYAAYEYRNDLQNRLYQLRRYAAARATARATTKKS